jgi:hypothetical protein
MHNYKMVVSVEIAIKICKAARTRVLPTRRVFQQLKALRAFTCGGTSSLRWVLSLVDVSSPPQGRFGYLTLILVLMEVPPPSRGSFLPLLLMMIFLNFMQGI